jgi:hypothetical protein
VSSQKLVTQFAKIGISFKKGMNVNAFIVNPCTMPSIVIGFQESKKKNTSNLVFIIILVEANNMIIK